MAGTQHEPRPAKAVKAAILLTIVMVVIYLANFRFIYTGDTAAVRYVPFSILMRGRLYVDGWVEPYFRVYLDHKLNYGIYFASQGRGHWMSSYPVLTPVVVSPLYIPAAWWLAHKQPPPTEQAWQFYAEAMEKLSAAVLAALSVGIFYLAIRRVLSPKGSLFLALIFGLASPTWNIASQVLMLHAMSELSFALLLWALLHDEESGQSAFWIGLALALAVANKLSNVVVAAPIVVWFMWKHRRRLAPFFAPLVAIGGLVLAYNLYYFQSPMGAYVQAFNAVGYSGVELRGNLFEGLAGLLLSPNRGMFIYVPWTLLSIAGAVRLWRDNPYTWGRFLIVGVVAHYVMYAKLDRWYAGYTFGPRYMTDVMPLLAFFLVPLWNEFTNRRLMKAALVATVALAFAVQLIGVYYYPNGDWNSKPVSVDDMPQRVWDWRDLQIVRTFRAGPAPTKLGDHLRGEHHSE